MGVPSPPSPLAPPAFALVVAADDARGIGRDGDLAWQLPADMRWFRTLTTGAGEQAVLMGRRTWESIPERFRPLPGRHNVVLSRRPDLRLPAGVARASSLEDGLAQCAAARAIFVIGGGAVYAAAWEHPLCRRLFLTAVSGEHGCDVHLPPLASNWGAPRELGSGQEGDLRYRFLQYDR